MHLLLFFPYTYCIYSYIFSIYFYITIFFCPYAPTFFHYKHLLFLFPYKYIVSRFIHPFFFICTYCFLFHAVTVSFYTPNIYLLTHSMLLLSYGSLIVFHLRKSLEHCSDNITSIHEISLIKNSDKFETSLKCKWMTHFTWAMWSIIMTISQQLCCDSIQCITIVLWFYKVHYYCVANDEKQMQTNTQETKERKERINLTTASIEITSLSRVTWSTMCLTSSRRGRVTFFFLAAWG